MKDILPGYAEQFYSVADAEKLLVVKHLLYEAVNLAMRLPDTVARSQESREVLHQFVVLESELRRADVIPPAR